MTSSVKLPLLIFSPDKKIITVITGFNTDIKYEGVTYHVQTEDKGVKTPLILSLVYQGGTILASKRTPYEDLVRGKFDERVLEARLHRQHSLICAAIRAGRIEDLKQMTQKASRAKIEMQADSVVVDSKVVPPPVFKKPLEVSIHKLEPGPSKVEDESVSVKPVELPPEVEEGQPALEVIKSAPNVVNVSEKKEVPQTPKYIIENQETTIEPPSPIVTENTQPEFVKPPKPEISPPAIVESEIEIPKPIDEPVWDIPIIEGVTIVEEGFVEHSQGFEEELILPSDAVEIIGDLEQFGSLLEDELKVKILGENQFKSGDRKNINILVCRGTDDSSVSDANVMVKVIGSDFRPMIYHSKADSNGVATVFVKLPTFRSGRAALMIRAMVDGEETELRRAILTD